MCEKLVILNKPLKFKISKVEPNCSPFYMREAPGTAYGGISIKPISGFIYAVTASDAPDSSSRVRGLDDRSFILVGEAVLCSAAKSRRTFFRA